MEVVSKKTQSKPLKKIPARQEQILFDHVLCAARGEGGAVLLVFELFSQEGHRPVEVMQGQGVDAVDHVIPMPAVTGAIRTGDEEPMQNRQEDRPLHVEPELPLCQKPADDLADLQFFPESLADQRRTDLLRIRPDVALPGEDQKNLLRKPGKGAHQVLDLALAVLPKKAKDILRYQIFRIFQRAIQTLQ